MHNEVEYTVITLTGDRHVPFKLCREWLLRQTVPPRQWLVIDDGEHPMHPEQYIGADYYRRKPDPGEPKHTIKLNMLEALKHIRYDRIIIMEDDDWYHPSYCEHMLRLLASSDLVGQSGAHFYYWPLTQIAHIPSAKHASLFKTGFSRLLYPVVENICRTIKGPLIDIALWGQPLGKRVLIPERPPLAIGMKGLLGRPGQTSGWNVRRRGYHYDSGNTKLRTFIGDDVEVYSTHFARIQRKPMDYEDREDKLYSWLWKEGPYADGRGAAPRIAKFVSWAKQVSDLKNLSIIDLGCGKAELANLLPYKEYLGVDISTYQIEQNTLNLADDRTKFLRHSIDTLPLNDMSHDLAICQDVMEHIPENRVDRVLREMFRVASAVMIIIDCKAAKLRGPNDEQLHCTIKSRNWWREKIERLSVVRYEDYQDYKLTLYCGSGYKSQGVFPDILYGIRLRRHPDGSVWISKQHKVVEKYMDKHFSRTHKQLRWHYKIQEPVSIKRLKNKYADQPCYIIGKGPSLDAADQIVFDPGAPIICLNQSVHHIESLGSLDDLYVMQQDTGINCRPTQATPLLHFYIKHLYPEIKSRYIFTDTDFGRPRHSLTVLVAIAAAKYMGCNELRLVAFDACVNQKTGYAQCIGHQPIKTHSGGPARFLTHKKRIIEEAGSMKIVWICPQRNQDIAPTSLTDSCETLPSQT